MVSVVVLLIGALSASERTAAGPRLEPVRIVEVTVPGPEARAGIIGGGYDVSQVRGNVITVYAADDELAALEAAGWPIRPIGVNPVAPDFTPNAKALGVYHNHAALTAALNAYAAAYPGICRLVSLGESVRGRSLWAILITDNPDAEEDEPEFKYIGAMHGDEQLGEEMCLYFIDYLLTQYGSNSRVTHLVDETAIWVLPLMNPDGLESGSRYNANGYDLNRSFPVYPDDFAGTYFDGEELGDLGRQPEVAHVMRWMADNSFVLSANFHTGEIVVNYPYDEDNKPSGTDAPSPDDLLFEDVSRRYAANNPTFVQQSPFPDGITNGSAWYAITGGMQDWNYRFVSSNEVTIELSYSGKPPQSTLAGHWSDNSEAMLAYLEAAHIGVRGLVTDGRTSDPLWAQVSVADNAHPVFTDPDVGDYYRMLLPGTYRLAYSSSGGYISRTIENVVVGDVAAARVDVELLSADVNNDGRVDAADVQLVINAILGYPVTQPCDFDGGGVTVTDLQKLINFALMRP